MRPVSELLPEVSPGFVDEAGIASWVADRASVDRATAGALILALVADQDAAGWRAERTADGWLDSGTAQVLADGALAGLLRAREVVESAVYGRTRAAQGR
jgi:hypothetical protein